MRHAHARSVRCAVLLAALFAASGCFHARKEAPRQQSGAPPIVGSPGQPVPPQPGPGYTVRTPESLFVPGAVELMKVALMQKGYLNPDRQLTLDPAIQDAIVRFQRDNNLPATGYPDAATLKALGFDPEQLYKKRTFPTESPSP